MTTTDSPTLSPDVLRARAEELIPTLREAAPEAERLRRLPDKTLAALEATGVIGAIRPAEAGGSGAGLDTYVELTRIISRGDASAGWAASFYMSNAWVLSRLSAEAQEEIFGSRPWVLGCGTASRPGQARKVDGGYRLTGNWGYASGVMHSTWVGLAGISDEGRLLMFELPIEDVEVLDTWHVTGMRGTGSNDVAVDDVFVPDRRAAPFEMLAATDCPGAALWDYDLLHYPMHRILTLVHPAVALGTADAALELFVDNGERRVRVENRRPMFDDPTIQSAYGRARQLVRTASLLLADAVAITDAGYGPGAQRPLTLEERAELNLAVTGAGVQACEAIDLLIRHSGASMHRTGNPLDRICRDIQVQRNHPILDWDYVSSVAGRVLLGRGLGDHPEATF